MDPNLKAIENLSVEIVTDSLGEEAPAELTSWILLRWGVKTGPAALDAHPECTVEREVAIGWSITLKWGFRRFRKRRNTTPNTTATISPPTTPPAIAGVFDLREDVEGLDDAELEWVEGGGGVGVDVGIAAINSGL